MTAIICECGSKVCHSFMEIDPYDKVTQIKIKTIQESHGVTESQSAVMVLNGGGLQRLSEVIIARLKELGYYDESHAPDPGTSAGGRERGMTTNDGKVL